MRNLVETPILNGNTEKLFNQIKYFDELFDISTCKCFDSSIDRKLCECHVKITLSEHPFYADQKNPERLQVIRSGYGNHCTVTRSYK